MLRSTIAITSLAVLAASAAAQTPTWAKAHANQGGLRIMNGTKMYVSAFDGTQYRAYDLVGSKFMSMPTIGLASYPDWMTREVSADGKRFLLHGDGGVNYDDVVVYMNGGSTVSFTIPSQRLDEFDQTMFGSTKLTTDGKYVLQLWANGDSDWYSAVNGAHIGTGIGAIVEVADGKAVTHDMNGFLCSVNLLTGAKTSFPFATPQFFTPIAGRNNLLVGKTNANAYVAINLTTGVQTPLNFGAGDVLAGVFSDGKTIAINNLNTQQAFAQKIGYARKLVGKSMTVAPDGTRGILGKSGIWRTIYNYGNDTGFLVEETDYMPFGFDANNRPVMNLENAVVRTMNDDGTTASEVVMPTVPAGGVTQFVAKDAQTLVYRTGTFYRRIDVATQADTAWFNAVSVPDWDIMYKDDGKTALIYKENPSTHKVGVNYMTPQGNSSFYELPVGTTIRGFAPNGRMLTTQWSAGKAWLRYYDPANGQLKKSVAMGTSEPSLNFGWSADGNTVAMQTMDDFRLVDITTSVVRRIGGQANSMVDMTGSDTAISLSADGTLMAFGPMVFKTSNYKLVFTVPGSQSGLGMISPNNQRFVYSGEMATESYALPAIP